MSEYLKDINYKEKWQLALETGYYNSKVKSSEEFRPKLLLNDKSRGSNILSHLTKELESCSEFKFSVAFVTDSGVTILLNSLRRLQEKRVSGKILTSDYLLFNNPKIFKKLLDLEVSMKFSKDGQTKKTIEVRIFDKGNFHAKGYIFKKSNESTIIVGSSNLTQEALKVNHEWNLKISSTKDGSLVEEMDEEFEECWQSSKPLTNEWILEYEKKFLEKNVINAGSMIDIKKHFDFKLNKMQRHALEALKKLREQGKDKALLISATGTGKTYLSAFDVLEFRPKKFLFVIHRENVAARAMESFQRIMGSEIKMSLFTGRTRDANSDYIFATIQSISRDEHLKKFAKDHFDYIVIDEVHRAGAPSYTKVIDYFKPKFMLGMSATPERNDDFNIFKVFDYNIAYEIRLQQAMEEDMLCPFHYFGISEITIDGTILDDNTSFANLTSGERIKHIQKTIEFYGHSGERARGLIFCSRTDEAIRLSEKMNMLGYKTIALTGDSTEENREIAIQKLEQEDRNSGLDYIFTVDIFNEGVDIPKVNQIVMLRPTQSAIIFIQQLGRGLRKAPDKDFVVVLDFIGNYQNNYMIPIALSGDKTYNKDNLRRFAIESSTIIPGCSTINFDDITRRRIFESIESARFSQIQLLKNEYQNMKRVVGRVPTINDFYDYGAIDPELFHQKLKSYYKFCVDYDSDYKIRLTDKQDMLLQFITQEFADGKRPHELIIMNEILAKKSTTISKIAEVLLTEYGIKNDEDSIKSALSLLEDGFLQETKRERYEGCTLVKSEVEKYFVSDYLAEAINDRVFIELLADLLLYSKKKYTDTYSTRHLNNNLVLNQKYSRKDACRLLNWDQDESSTIYGYKIKHNTCPIFVTYEKQESIAYSTKYEDAFAGRERFSWMTRSKIRIDSKEALAIKNQIQSGLRIHLFVKKKDGENRDHYYLGELKQIEMIETTMKKDDKKEEDKREDDKKELPVVNVQFEFVTPVREDIYDYLVAQENLHEAK